MLNLFQHLRSSDLSVSVEPPPLYAVRVLLKLCMLPVAVIPQVGRRPCLIFGFIWSSQNEATACKAPEEMMCLGGTLHHIIQRLLMDNQRLGPVYLGKVDLENAYIMIWVRL